MSSDKESLFSKPLFMRSQIQVFALLMSFFLLNQQLTIQVDAKFQLNSLARRRPQHVASHSVSSLQPIDAENPVDGLEAVNSLLWFDAGTISHTDSANNAQTTEPKLTRRNKSTRFNQRLRNSFNTDSATQCVPVSMIERAISSGLLKLSPLMNVDENEMKSFVSEIQHKCLEPLNINRLNTLSFNAAMKCAASLQIHMKPLKQKCESFKQEMEVKSVDGSVATKAESNLADRSWMDSLSSVGSVLSSDNIDSVDSDSSSAELAVADSVAGCWGCRHGCGGCGGCDDLDAFLSLCIIIAIIGFILVKCAPEERRYNHEYHYHARINQVETEADDAEINTLTPITQLTCPCQTIQLQHTLQQLKSEAQQFIINSNNNNGNILQLLHQFLNTLQQSSSM